MSSISGEMILRRECHSNFVQWSQILFVVEVIERVSLIVVFVHYARRIWSPEIEIQNSLSDFDRLEFLRFSIKE
jgi:hypothetical protein